jgi:hypothetical protein
LPLLASGSVKELFAARLYSKDRWGKQQTSQNINFFSFHMCYTRFGAYPNHMHIRISVKNKLLKKEKEEKAKEKQEHR